ncbi:heavy metal-responsive transcriptional regulator [Spirulina sp. CS-785/01]|uniref:heavy metal-responsive transcriptional regulator n=1 Tax=Spirulina sp. CS-785/01 TaxID=3021716 RepID=UPI00232F2B2F|nr:heavy metal-responsive transcriptional regulator [Spirulina sp. CS-785/01]MDB9313019.1 heavy metal-responsive transcriptional regulator [Spirulina sp. CS-785/01]
MVDTASPPLKIGQVASESGLSVKTIRYYEELGLLTPVVHRSKAGYRLFDRKIFNRLAFIKRSQSLGLSLQEIQDILTVHDHGELPCGTVKEHLQQKLDEITQKIESLQILQSELQGILSGWQEHPSQDKIETTICPNIQTR